jgi:hypothetical protein
MYTDDELSKSDEQKVQEAINRFNLLSELKSKHAPYQANVKPCSTAPRESRTVTVPHQFTLSDLNTAKRLANEYQIDELPTLLSSPKSCPSPNSIAANFSPKTSPIKPKKQHCPKSPVMHYGGGLLGL